MKEIFIKAPGKIIISGEHSAVYGYPAVVAATDRNLSLSFKYEDKLDNIFFLDLLHEFGESGTDKVIKKITKYIGKSGRLEINSRIPIGSGMGSSAAIAAALSMLVLELSGKKYNRDNINRCSFELEKIAHKNPSGIDNMAVVYGGINKFFKNNKGEMIREEIKGRNFLDRVFIVDTGRPVETTAEMVSVVRERYKTYPKKMGLIMNSIGKTTEMIQDLIINGRSEKDFMKFISGNQKLLEKIGVVGKKCQKFIKLIESLGGSAKISGAGGYLAESGTVIVYLPKNIEIISIISTNGYHISPLRISDGIKIFAKIISEIN